MIQYFSIFVRVKCKTTIVLTIEIPDRKAKGVTEFIEKIGGRVVAQDFICMLDHTPNAQTIAAMEETKTGKPSGFGSIKELFEYLGNDEI